MDADSVASVATASSGGSLATDGEEEAVVLESGVRLSRSVLYTLQRAFYEQHSIDAWSKGLVPNYITTNAFIANQYADVVAAYWDDLGVARSGHRHGTDSRAASSGTGRASQPQPLDSAHPVYIIEIGSASARFAHYFIHALRRKLRRRRHMHPIRWCYVMTDFVPATVKAWMANKALQPYFQAGVLDCAVYDCRKPYKPLRLAYSKSVLSPGTLANPAVMISNYTFCVVEMEAFDIDPDGSVFEANVTTMAPAAAAALTPLPPSLIPETRSTFARADTPLPVMPWASTGDARRWTHAPLAQMPVRFGTADEGGGAPALSALDHVLEYYRQVFGRPGMMGGTAGGRGTAGGEGKAGENGERKASDGTANGGERMASGGTANGGERMASGGTANGGERKASGGGTTSKARGENSQAAAGASARADGQQGDGETGEGDASAARVGVPLVLPSAGARCIDALSQLSRGGRRLLCLVSDKAYTQQQELLGCDAFSISHEGSFSLMVNLHALGLLARVWGGTALHSTETVTEQGDTCLATSALVIDAALRSAQGGKSSSKPFSYAAGARGSGDGEGAPTSSVVVGADDDDGAGGVGMAVVNGVVNDIGDVRRHNNSHIRCVQRLKDIVSQLAADPSDVYRVVRVRGENPLVTEQRFSLAHGSRDDVYHAAFVHMVCAFRDGVQRVSPTDVFRVLHSVDRRVDGGSEGEGGEEGEGEGEGSDKSTTPSMQELLALLRVACWDAGAVMHHLSSLLDALDGSTADEKLAVARGLITSLNDVLFIGEEEDIAFDFGRCFYQMQLPGHEAALVLYLLSITTQGAHPITFYNIGLCYKEARQYGKAVAHFDKCLALDPTYAPARLSRQHVLELVTRLAKRRRRRQRPAGGAGNVEEGETANAKEEVATTEATEAANAKEEEAATTEATESTKAKEEEAATAETTETTRAEPREARKAVQEPPTSGGARQQ